MKVSPELLDALDEEDLSPARVVPWYRDWKLFIGIITVVTLAFLLISFVGFPTSVSGNSMYPTYKDRQSVLVYKTYSSINRYDIVAIDGDRPLIKRVVGLPNETVQIANGKVYINSKLLSDDVISVDIKEAGKASSPIVLGENEYFVLGDNRNNSSDSREYGAFSEEQILGKIAFSKNK